jgi:hypothetical protein
MLKNNCEHFVTWCICGLNASLQVKSWYMQLRETVYSVAAGVARYAVDYVGTAKVGPAFLVAAAANVSDEIAAGFLTSVGSNAAYIFGGILEAFLAVYQLAQAAKQWQEGILIPTGERFVAKTTEICTKSACRFGCGVAGSVIGSAFGPVGSLVGGAIGAGIGHLIVSFFGWLLS